MYLDKLVKDQKNVIDRLVQVTVAQELSMRRGQVAELSVLENDDTLSNQHKRTGSDKIGAKKKLTEE